MFATANRGISARAKCALAGVAWLFVYSSALADAGASAISREAAQWLARVTYGPDSATLARFRELGKQRFLEEQLAARDEHLPDKVQRAIDALDISKLSGAEVLAEARAGHDHLNAIADPQARAEADKALVLRQMRLSDQAVHRELLRAIYSPAQLKEQLVWFWLNHFSVYAGKVGGIVGDYAERAIRPHALGHFGDLVMATVRHPAMLLYLDNTANTAHHVNENYARELMELHTLGVDSGYTQRDVQELARILTGVGLHRDAARPPKAEWQGLYLHDGAFEFDPEAHDFGDKTLLGRAIRGDGFAEVEQAVNLLVSQPACAHFISHKLAVYFVADNPPTELVDRMAQTFQRSSGNISDVLAVMFAATEFAPALGTKFKDPMHFIVSSLRLADDDGEPRNVDQIRAALIAMEELPFSRVTPDGFAMTESAWASPGQFGRRFEMARVIGSTAHGHSLLPDSALSRSVIVPFLSPATSSALARATSIQERNMFLLASPDFNYY